MSENAITLKQLRYLVELDETRNFRRAAARCDISQPSLSIQIRNIEDGLGVTLVERNRSGLAFTPVGRDVVQRARRVLEEVRGIVDFTAGAQHGLAGTIKLGAKPTLGPYLLPHVVAKLHRQHPDLHLYVREGAPRDLEFELGRGVHDMILAQLPIAGEHLEVRRLFREPLYLAFAEDHPLARKDHLTVKDLEGLDVLSLSPDFHLHDQINALCQDFGARMLRDYEGTSLDALRQMVGMGMGVTFLPALYVHSEISARSEIVVSPFKDKTITRSVGLVWRKSAGRYGAYEEMATLIGRVAATTFKTLIIDGS